MKLILDKFESIGFNQKPFTEDDFFKLCETEKIRVGETPEPFTWWMNLDGESHIVIYKKERGYKLLFKMFHELGHHFLHGGEELNAVQPFGSNNSRNEFEADFFATVAIYPRSALFSGELLEFEPFDPFLRQIRINREKIFFLYGI